eukprot:Rmarinus@m.12701
MSSELDTPICVIGNYEVCGVVNKGGNAVVRKGYNIETGEMVALKFMSRSHLEASKMVSYVKREIEYGMKLHHPNVIALKDKMLTNDHVILVFEFIIGCDLLELVIKHKRLTEDQARLFFVQLLDGVEYIHEKGMCHRDLKPDNLLVSEGSNALKIADFGFTKRLVSVNRSKVGTAEYMAPEVSRQTDYDGRQVDVWSIGCVLYVMLVGTFPFQDPKNPRQSVTLYNSVNGILPVGFPGFLSAEVIDLMKQIFMIDPSQRPSLKSIKQHPWVRAVTPPRVVCPKIIDKSHVLPEPDRKGAEDIESAYKHWEQPENNTDGELDADVMAAYDEDDCEDDA